jgi:AraC family transcriptional activator FtrA
VAERVEHAKRLLEGSALPVERIATEVGLGSMQALRHHFQQQLGLSPRQYRAMFLG